VTGERSRQSKMTFADYLRERVETALARGKSEEEIVNEAGFHNARHMSMLLTGEAKLPLDKVLLASRALGADARLMFRLAIQQYWKASDAELDKILGTT
jgi:hypothetical protein